MQIEREQLYDRIVSALRTEDDARLAAALADMHAADIAEVLNTLDDETRSRCMYALPPHTAAEVFVMFSDAVRGDVADELDTQSLSEIVSQLEPDDAADVLGELTDEASHEILERMPDERSDKLEELLDYDESTAGGIMTPSIVALSATATVVDAIESVRAAPQEDDLHDIYVTDAGGKPIGTVPLRRLVTSGPGARLLDIADDDPVTVVVTEDQEAVLRVIRKYDVSEAGVVNEQGRLVGRITHDDLLDVADEEAEEDMLRMAGTGPSELDTSSVFRAAGVRLTWLLPCMGGMLGAAWVMGISKPKLGLLFGGLALFVPMIGAIGGNAGIQTATIIVRGFAVGDLGSTQLLRAFLREGRIALAMAPVCGLLAWILSRITYPILHGMENQALQLENPGRVPLAVGVAMTAAILVASSLGITLPFLFRRIGVDPAIAAGPIVTTLNDVVSLSIFMLTAMSLAA